MAEQSFWEKIKPLGKYVADTAKNVAVGLGSEYKKAFTEKNPDSLKKETSIQFAKEMGNTLLDIPRYALRGITSVGMDLFNQKEFTPDKDSWAEKALYGEEKLKSFSTRMNEYEQSIKANSGFDQDDKFPAMMAAGLAIGSLWADASLSLGGGAKKAILRNAVKNIEKKTGQKVSEDIITRIANKVDIVTKDKNIKDKNLEIEKYLESVVEVEAIKKRKIDLESRVQRNSQTFMPDEQIELSNLNKKIKDFNGENNIVDDVAAKTDNFTSQNGLTPKYKNLSEKDVVKEIAPLNAKNTIQAKDIQGNKIIIEKGEALASYELKDGKYLLQDGETYVVNKNQYQNIKGQSIVGEGKEFAPELKTTKETVLGNSKSHDAKLELLENKYNEAEEVKNFIREKLGSNPYQSGQPIRWMYKDANGVAKDVPSEFIQKLNDAESSMWKYNNYIETVGDDYFSTLETKYSQYTLPNGKDYKEILIQAPDKATEIENSLYKKYGVSDRSELMKKISPEDRGKLTTAITDKRVGNEKGFQSTHWDEPNVISHIRTNTRTYNSEKVQFLEELQSDWAREGRRVGFLPEKPLTREEYFKPGNIVESYGGQDKVIAYYPGDPKAPYPKNNWSVDVIAVKPDGSPIRGEMVRNHSTGPHIPTKGVPNNSNLKNWQELSIKRALKEAVDNDAKYFSWINGEQTSARYNLSTHVDNVMWKKLTETSPRHIEIKAKRGKDIVIEADKNGIITFTSDRSWKGKKLDEVLGKGLADKIMEKETGTLAGDGLKFGGEWATNLYDKQVKNIVENLTGQKVEMVDFGLSKNADKNWLFEGGGLSGARVMDNLNKIKVGDEISDYGRKQYKIIKKLDKTKYELEEVGAIDGGRSIVDFSQKTTQQQAIKITPEVKAIINGEAPPMKLPSKRKPFEAVSKEISKNMEMTPPEIFSYFMLPLAATEQKFNNKANSSEEKPTPSKYMDLTGYINPPTNIKTEKSQIDGNGIINMYGKLKNSKYPTDSGTTEPVNVIRVVDGKKQTINANNLDDILNAYKVKNNYGGSIKTIGNLDLETIPYASRKKHAQEIQEIYNTKSPRVGKAVKDFDYNDMKLEFEKLKSPLQYISGQISQALDHYGIAPGEFVAVVRKDSQAGTDGASIETKNPGNVGNTDDGSLTHFATWIEGSVAAIRNLAERKVKSSNISKK